MNKTSRRQFFTQSSLGLAAAGTTSLLLVDEALPTVASGSLGDYGRLLQQERQRQGAAREVIPVRGNRQPARWNVTEPNILGPYHRVGAPFRAKITPPMAQGEVIVISGRVWGADTRRPLPHAIIDVWQADHNGRYDNDDPRNPPAATVFKNRARLIADENGYYEYESILPGAYQIGRNAWRPKHIHYLVRHPNYRDLITQLYFQGDRHNRTDQFIRQSLIINLQQQRARANANYKTGTFDIVLARAPRRGNDS